MKARGLPVTAVAGAMTPKWVAAMAVTVINADVPLRYRSTPSASAAAKLRAPAVLMTTAKTPTPSVRVVSAGTWASGSVQVTCTVPPYVVTVLLFWSSATTLRINPLPAWTVVGLAKTARCVAGFSTEIGLVVPVMLAVVASLAVMVWLPAVLKETLKTPTPLVKVTRLGKKAGAVGA